MKPRVRFDRLRSHVAHAVLKGLPMLWNEPGACLLLLKLEGTLPRWRRPESDQPADVAERWRWWWSGYPVDEHGRPRFLAAAASAASMTLSRAGELWPLIVESRILWPGLRGQLCPEAFAALLGREMVEIRIAELEAETSKRKRKRRAIEGTKPTARTAQSTE